MSTIIKMKGARVNPLARIELADGTVSTNLNDHKPKWAANQIVEVDVPVVAPPADFESHPDWFIVGEDWDTGATTYSRKSDEQIAEIQLAKAKRLRTEAVERITVQTTAGHVFDGDERSQDRMARAIVAMGDADSINWVLANNSVEVVSKEELREALRLAGAAMAAEWVKPYQ